MTAAPSIWNFIFHASFIVKLVMLLLFLASIASWTLIIQRYLLFRQALREARAFENIFWSGTDLAQLGQKIQHRKNVTGLAGIFHAGYQEYIRLTQQPEITSTAIMEGVQRAMRIAQAREIELLEKHLAFLATVGSTSPYVGLFGTVWGIMSSFRMLGNAQQATLAAVATGISEALIATAMGLFAAIPAVIAYNRYSQQLDRLTQHYEIFQEEFSNILHRQIYA